MAFLDVNVLGLPFVVPMRKEPTLPAADRAGTIGNEMPGVPAGPGSYPGSFSEVDPTDAVFVGDTPPANAATCMIARNGGTTLKTTGSIMGTGQTSARPL